MAKKKKASRSAGAAATERSSPLVPHALLWVGFLAILAIGVVTVFVPELTDESDEDGGATTEEPTAPEGAPTADPPVAPATP